MEVQFQAANERNTLASAAPPRVWLLVGDRAGDRAQLTGLAQSLGWPYITKHLHYNNLRHLPNLLLGASLLTLHGSDRAELRPPWPDLILDCGRRSVPVAGWIRRQSEGRARWVHLGRPWAPYHWFDLIVTTPQYRLPPGPNLLGVTMPFHTVTANRLADAASQWRERLDALPRPWTALLVGGSSSSQVFDTSAATRLAKKANEAAAGGSLLISTSPRTPPAVAAALRQAISVPCHFHAWNQAESENPYLAFLALADRIIVTGDSASMVAEACSTGKPVSLFPLGKVAPVERGKQSGRRSALAGAFDPLVRMGIFMPARDMAAYQNALLANGLVARIEEPARIPDRQLDHEARDVVARIRLLTNREPTGLP